MKTEERKVEKLWECPNCTITAKTSLPPDQSATPHHTCKGMAGLLVPMVPKGSKTRLVAVEREDFVGSETVQSDGNGRPVMNVRTERPDGSNDLTIYAPLAAVTAVHHEEN